MNRPLLNDKNEYPNDDVLVRYLGKTKAIWDAFVVEISSTFPSMSFEWKFYNNGKSWLCKLVHKKKTMCWISIWENYFKVGFYFTDKDNKAITGLKIDQRLKDSYRSTKSSGRFKPLTIDVKTKKALLNIIELTRYRSK